jgi:N-acetylglucosamine-6-phosphate deacetylase
MSTSLFSSLMRPRALVSCVSALIGVASLTLAQQPALLPPANGPRQVEATALALVGATVHTEPGKVVNKGTIIIRDGVISEVLSDGAAAPANMPTRDISGMHVYAGFVEPYVLVDVPRPDPEAPGSHWNARVVPQRNALDRGSAGVDAKTSETLRSMGFTSANIVPKGGIFQGSTAVVSLAPTPKYAAEARPRVYREKAMMGVSFEMASDDDGAARAAREEQRWGRYPGSEMGSIALIRQTLSDADWQAGNRDAGAIKDAPNALDHLRKTGEGTNAGPVSVASTLVFDCEDELEVLRAAKIAKEFSRSAVIFGSGLEYRRLEAVKETGLPVILPLTYRKAPGVNSIGAAESVGLNELIAWEQGPTNPRRVDSAGITAAFTTSRIGEKQGGRGAFAERLSSAIKHGLPKDRALAMLTTNPAKLVGMEGTLGVVAPGARANLVLSENELFTDVPDAPKRGEPGYLAAGRIIDVYVDGERFPVASRQRTDLEGEWTVQLTPAPRDTNVRTLRINDEWPPAIEITRTPRGADDKADSKKTSKTKARDVVVDVPADGSAPSAFRFMFDHAPLGLEGVFTMECWVEKNDKGETIIRGEMVRTQGERATFVATRTGDVPDKKDKAKPGLAGTWVQLVNNQPVGPDDAEHPHVVIQPDSDKKVLVKKGSTELEVSDVTLEPGDKEKGTEPLVSFKVKGVHGEKPDDVTSVWLAPIKDTPDRLSGRFEAAGAEVFQLARFKETPETDAIKQIPEKLGLPVGAYARQAMPEQKTWVLKGANIWTSGPKGVIENGTVIVGDGKIMFVGTGDEGESYLSRVRFGSPLNEVDLKGKYLSPGIIDCHSHTGISKGVNEGGQAVTAEVRIGDVTDPDSVSWYRQLAGGTTCVNSLHGSANPIGGQNQVNKIRWGCLRPDDMHLEGAIGGIKFALGENVKQSNWGDSFQSRYPQTRMGVETLMRDRFTAAKEYLEARQKGIMLQGANGRSEGSPVRRDLELEALAEIITGKRLIHCHSYRQDEILMLCRVARDFGFKIGTFQHGLECYKVADEVKQQAIGASIFTDWWAYKMEVQDAIPFAGPIMHEQGIPVSFNSDSDELARRLSVEAGKATKYSRQVGGTKIEPSEAFKFVTINPAKQLKIDDKVGSIEEGKDADLVVWSGPPSSSLSRCERTFVDGREMFSLDSDREMRVRNETERRRLIQKVLKGGKSSGGKGKATGGDDDFDASGDESDQPNVRSRRSLIHEASSRAADARRAHYLSLYLRGIDPRFYRSGDCGCEAWNLGN